MGSGEQPEGRWVCGAEDGRPKIPAGSAPSSPSACFPMQQSSQQWRGHKKSRKKKKRLQGAWHPPISLGMLCTQPEVFNDCFGSQRASGCLLPRAHGNSPPPASRRRRRRAQGAGRTGSGLGVVSKTLGDLDGSSPERGSRCEPWHSRQ